MKTNNIFKSLVLVLTLAALCLTIKHVFGANIVNAALDTSYLDKIQSVTDLPTFDSSHGQAIQRPGVSNITSAVFFVLDMLKFLIGGVAVIMLILTGVRLIIARKKIDEVWPKQKEHLIMIAVGFVLIMLADYLVKRVLFGAEGEVYQSEASVQLAAGAATEQIKGIYNLAMIFVGILAVLMTIIAGFRLLTSAGNEEAQTKVKKQMTWLVIGLFVIGIAEFVVQDFIFPNKGVKIPAAEQGIKLIVSFTNFAAAFISIIAFIVSLYGGYLYVIAAGNEEQTSKAKKVLMGAIIALILGLGAFAIVNSVIQLEPGA
jgi:Ca2+/Na+ antiporter